MKRYIRATAKKSYEYRGHTIYDDGYGHCVNKGGKKITGPFECTPDAENAADELRASR